MTVSSAHDDGCIEIVRCERGAQTRWSEDDMNVREQRTVKGRGRTLCAC